MVLFDHAVYGGQTQTGSFAGFFGREKRLENFVHGFGVYAAAIVADDQDHMITRQASRVVDRVLFVKGRCIGLYGDLAHIVDGVPGVDAEIGQNLVDLSGIDSDRPDRVARQPFQGDILSDEALEQTYHAGDGSIEVENFGRYGLFAGKHKKLAGQVGGSFAGFSDLLQIRVKGPGWVHLFQSHVGMSDDHAEHVVEIMGHAAGQPAHGFHFLGLDQLTFQLFSLCFGPVSLRDV